MDREVILLRIKNNATQYLTHHRWEAVSVDATTSSTLLPQRTPPPTTTTTTGKTQSKGTALIESIRDDLIDLRTVSMKVIHYIYLWRQDQMLTLHERQHPTEYPPKPFVYNGHDYILKMIHDLNFLKDVQPISNWLGAPLLRNPFALMSDDPMCIDNLDMQFDGSLADLASCAHLPPPPPMLVLDLLVHKNDPLCVKWSSLLLLAQEAIYGKGPEGSSLMTGYSGTRTVSGMIRSGSGSGSGSSSTFQSNFQVTQSLLSENGSGNNNKGRPFAEKQHPLPVQHHPQEPRNSTKKRTSPAIQKQDRAKVVSKVKGVISQNTGLRLELERLRKQLEVERETVYQLEKEEDEKGGEEDD